MSDVGLGMTDALSDIVLYSSFVPAAKKTYLSSGVKLGQPANCPLGSVATSRRFENVFVASSKAMTAIVVPLPVS